MRKLDKTFYILILTFCGIGIMICLISMIAIFTSCQPPPDPLKNAEFPCECIFKSTTTHAIKFKCQDGEYYFIDKSYYNTFKKDTIINEPLNK